MHHRRYGNGAATSTKMGEAAGWGVCVGDKEVGSVLEKGGTKDVLAANFSNTYHGWKKSS